MEIKTIKNNQFVIINGNIVAFQSYKTIIAIYDKDTRNLQISNKWNFSRTTSKYFYQFLRDYCSIYISTKKDFEFYLKENGIECVNYDIVFNP